MIKKRSPAPFRSPSGGSPFPLFSLERKGMTPFLTELEGTLRTHGIKNVAWPARQGIVNYAEFA